MGSKVHVIIYKAYRMWPSICLTHYSFSGAWCNLLLTHRVLWFLRVTLSQDCHPHIVSDWVLCPQHPSLHLILFSWIFLIFLLNTITTNHADTPSCFIFHSKHHNRIVQMDAYLSVYSLSLPTKALLTCVFLKSTSTHRATHKTDIFLNEFMIGWMNLLYICKETVLSNIDKLTKEHMCWKIQICERINAQISNPNSGLTTESFYPLDRVEMH